MGGHCVDQKSREEDNKSQFKNIWISTHNDGFPTNNIVYELNKVDDDDDANKNGQFAHNNHELARFYYHQLMPAPVNLDVHGNMAKIVPGYLIKGTKWAQVSDLKDYDDYEPLESFSNTINEKGSLRTRLQKKRKHKDDYDETEEFELKKNRKIDCKHGKNKALCNKFKVPMNDYSSGEYGGEMNNNNNKKKYKSKLTDYNYDDTKYDDTEDEYGAPRDDYIDSKPKPKPARPKWPDAMPQPKACCPGAKPPPEPSYSDEKPRPRPNRPRDDYDDDDDQWPSKKPSRPNRPNVKPRLRPVQEYDDDRNPYKQTPGGAVGSISKINNYVQSGVMINSWMSSHGQQRLSGVVSMEGKSKSKSRMCILNSKKEYCNDK